MLGQIEREESNPTVQTLWKIALGFRTSLSTFLPTEQKNEAVLHHQDEVVSVKIIQPFNADLSYEILYIQLKANSTHDSCAHEKNVIEDILPLSGTVTIQIEDKTYTAQAGETIRFNADQAHRYVNTGDTDLEFYNIIHYPR